jgi:sugar O-acyltransferase (sialic acid O-acetyltransferase NeuD family)
MKNQKFLLYGAGGHATVVLEAAAALGYSCAAIFDDGSGQLPHPMPDWDDTQVPLPMMVRGYSASVEPSLLLHIAIGDNRIRARLSVTVKHRLLTLVHPAAYVSPSAELGAGTLVLPKAVVHSGAHIAEGCIVNTGALVEHHTRIGAYVHLGPGAILCGGVSIGAGTLIGAGAVVEKGIRVGAGCTLASGTVVVSDVPDGVVVKGVPGRW